MNIFHAQVSFNYNITDSDKEFLQYQCLPSTKYLPAVLSLLQTVLQVIFFKQTSNRSGNGETTKYFCFQQNKMFSLLDANQPHKLYIT